MHLAAERPERRSWEPFTDEDRDALNTPLAAIGAPLVITEALTAAGIVTVGDALAKRPAELLSIWGISKVKLATLLRLLASAGFGKPLKTELIEGGHYVGRPE
jgi:hypothetical protein